MAIFFNDFFKKSDFFEYRVKKALPKIEQCDFSDRWSDLYDGHKDYFLTKMY